MDNLVNNYYFLRRLIPKLRSDLKYRRIGEAYAQNKHEYVFLLDEGKQGDALVFYFGNNISFVFPDHKAKPKSGTKQIFGAINGKDITDVQVNTNDRSFVINLSGNYNLLFKLYGTHGNVILFEDDCPIDTIRKSLQKDQNTPLSHYQIPIDQSLEAYQQVLGEGMDCWDALQQLFPTFTKDFRNWLTENKFHEVAEPESQWQLVNDLLNYVNTCSYFLHNDNPGKLDDTGYRVSFFKGEEAIESFDDPLKAVKTFASNFLREASLLNYKQMLVSFWQREIKQRQKKVKSFNNKLQKLVEAYDYRQLADIIMANLHNLEKGSTQATLYDFYNDSWVTLSLKKSLSPQANAERFYQKAKNQNIELNTAEANLAKEEERLSIAKAEYEQVMQETDFKTLKQLYEQHIGDNKPKKSGDLLKAKFKHYHIQQFDIYVGKGAATNDLLTFQFAKKEDIWLHAREQKGAHVIIRAGKGQSVPAEVLESAGQLAAAFAKRKGEAMTPVVYTRKKYVWKPRGAEPGQVNYKNEALLMVEPIMPELDS